jgi:aryl-alcohol dehydrogenase-like predicted oxidoreductase
MIAQLDESLRRLQTDYADLYWLHGWDRRAPIEETLRALDDLVAAGKVRYVGFSNVPAWVAAQSQTGRPLPRLGAAHRAPSTRCSSAPSRASCCRWPPRSVSASCPRAP